MTKLDLAAEWREVEIRLGPRFRRAYQRALVRKARKHITPSYVLAIGLEMKHDDLHNPHSRPKSGWTHIEQIVKTIMRRLR